MLCVLIIPNDFDDGYRVVLEQTPSEGLLPILYVRMGEEIEVEGTAYKVLRIRHSTISDTKVVYVYLARRDNAHRADWVTPGIRQQVAEHILSQPEYQHENL